MIFTRDFVTRENYWQIASLVTQKSLFTVTHALFFISPLLMHWRYCSLALSHRYMIHKTGGLSSLGVAGCGWLLPWNVSLKHKSLLSISHAMYESCCCHNKARMDHITTGYVSLQHALLAMGNRYFLFLRLNQKCLCWWCTSVVLWNVTRFCLVEFPGLIEIRRIWHCD